MSSFTPEQLAELNNLLDGRLTTNLSNVNTSGEALPNLRSAGASVVKEFWQQGTEWYRLWSDGWLEQGGHVLSYDITITLPHPFASSTYTVATSFKDTNSPDDYAYSYPQVRDKFPTSFRIQCGYSGKPFADDVDWYACGMADTSN